MVTTNDPKISICIPTYKGASYIYEALESILVQDYKDLEVIISDDASKDDTLKIVREFKDKVDFPVHIFNHEPQGIGANWNHAILQSTGAYVKLLFQDDVLLPGCLKAMAQLLDTHPEIGMVSSKRKFMIEGDMQGKEIEDWLAKYKDLQAEFPGPHEPFLRLDKRIFSMKSFFESPLNKVGEPSVYMFRRSLYDQIGPFREDLKQILDYEFCYRLLKVSDIAILPEELAAFRLHAAQATNVNRCEDIPDYRVYEETLYSDYRMLLHPELRKKLMHKYHPFYIFIAKVKMKLELTLKK